MFSQDLVFTEQFGKYVPSGGKVTVPANGDSLLDVLLSAFATDSNPSITQPSVNISSSSFKAYEVGTNVTPSYTATLNPGSYQYGPATGITATSWNVVDNAAEPNTLTTASGSFPQMQVVDDTSYSITATASYGAGTIPNTALGQEYADGQIKAGSKSATKGTITGYRNGFYGTTTSQSSGTFESDNIRALTATNKAVTAGTAAGVQTALTGTAEDTASDLTLNGIKKYVDQEVTGAVADATGEAQELINALDMSAVSAGTGQVIGSVSQTDGVVSATLKTLTASDIPTIEQGQVNGLTAALAGKQDTLVFNTAYNAQTNKAATMTDITNAVAGLSGAMHYVGESTTDPSTGTATVEGHEDWVSGDVVTYQSKEYVYDGENWRELGDESSYAIKGSIVDADIAANANIAQSKIANLVTDLAAKATPQDITNAINGLDMTTVTVATGSKVGTITQTNGVVSVTTAAIVADDIPTLPQSKITNLTTDLAAKASQTDLTALTGRVKTLESDNTTNKADIAELQADVANKIDTSAVSQIGKTGNINDAIQTSGDYLIFNCGSSSSVI